MALTPIDLRVDAISEATRLSYVRAVSQADIRARLCNIDHGSIVARTRRNASRGLLAGRLLLVFRVALHDANGGALETHLIGALVATAQRPGRPRDRLRGALRDAEPAARHAIRARVAIWFDAAKAATEGRVTAWARRQRAILERRNLTPVDPLQSGLFDRRAEHEADAITAAACEHDRVARGRLCRASDASAAETSVELVLVLAP